MKKRRILTALAVLLVMLCVAPAAYAAQPGETVTMEIPFADVYGIDGTFTYSNREMFQSVTYQVEGMTQGNVVDDICFYYSEGCTSGKVLVTMVLAEDVQDGESCTVQFSYETSDDEGNTAPWQVASFTVTAEVPQPETTVPPTEPPTTVPPTEPPTTAPPTTAPAVTEPAPTETDPLPLLDELAMRWRSLDTTFRLVLAASVGLNILLICVLIYIAAKQSEKTKDFVLPDFDDEE